MTKDQLRELSENEQTYLTNLQSRLKRIQADIEAQTALQRQREKKDYDKRHRVRQIHFSVGDQVWLKRLGPQAGSSKVLTDSKFIGPFRVSKIVNPCPQEHYRIVNMQTGREYRYPVAHDRLKLYTGLPRDEVEPRGGERDTSKKRYVKAVEIFRRRKSADGTEEYFVKLQNGTRIWSSDVDPDLARTL